MKETAKQALKKILGIFLILFGITAIIVPFLPGWWFIPIGLQILGVKLVFDARRPLESLRTLRKNTVKKPADSNKQSTI